MNELYRSFFSDIKQRIRAAQYNALRAANAELVRMYWDIGQAIADRQTRNGWGAAVVETLAKDIQQEFPGIKGFSAANIWRMKNFYLQYAANEKLAPLVREISWSHNMLIVERCSDDLEREYYLKATAKFGWSKRTLQDNLRTKSYQKFLMSQTNFTTTLGESQQKQSVFTVKDEYTFDFLELEGDYSERELEHRLVAQIQRFLAEMGGYFTFVGQQFRLEIEGEEFFIDLLLYHRALRSLVAIELKTGAFKPEYAGKMQFYLSVLNDRVKLPDENTSIGIIICREKNRAFVEYTLRNVNEPIGVATYSTTNELPEHLRGLLPSPEEIAEKLSIFRDDEGL
ncbi:MAG: PDDEXK nuclease domain-containing protein [Candidatus Kapaibacterium sp.]